MNDHEYQLKQQAEKASRDRPADMCATQTQAVSNVGCARVPLREQLEKRTYGLAEQHGRVTRALDILNRHPEFEEFLQLQELINSGLYF